MRSGTLALRGERIGKVVARPSRLLRRSYFLAVAALVPFLEPELPGNTVPFDYVNAVYGVVFVCGVLIARPVLRLPMLGPVFLMMLGGSIGASVYAVGFGMSVGAAWIVQYAISFYLVLWFLLLVNVIQTWDDVRSLVRATVAVGTLLAAVALVGIGVDVFGTFRYRGAFRNPNMASFYFVVVFFLALAVGKASLKVVRYGAPAVLLLAVLATGSVTALYAVGVGLGVLGVVSLFGSLRTAPKAIASVLAIGVAVGGIAMAPEDLSVLEVGRERLPVSIGRAETKQDQRISQWEKAWSASQEFEHLGLGLGPGWSTGTEEGTGPHNQYMRHYIERGAIGLVGLVWFYATLLAGLQKRRRRWERSGRPAGSPGQWLLPLQAGVLALVVYSVGNDVFHFRYFWLFVAVCAAVVRLVDVQS